MEGRNSGVDENGDQESTMRRQVHVRDFRERRGVGQGGPGDGSGEMRRDGWSGDRIGREDDAKIGGERGRMDRDSPQTAATKKSNGK